MAPLIEHRWRDCPRGHPIRPYHIRVSWQPCGCPIAVEAAEEHAARWGTRPGAAGHITVWCADCHKEHVSTIRYHPPHDVRHPESRGYPPPALSGT